MTKQFFFMLTVILLGFSSLAQAQDAKEVYEKALRKCANNDLRANPLWDGKGQIFFGSDFAAGTGTVIFIPKTGGGQGALITSDYTKDKIPLNPTTSSFCNSTTIEKIGVNPKISLSSILPVTPELNLQYENARKIKLGAEKFEWESVRLIPFKNLLLASKDNENLKDVFKGNEEYYFLTRALKVTNMSAEIEFNRKRQAEVKAAIPAGTFAVPVGDVNVGVTVSYTAENTIKIETKQTVYIVGEFYQYEPIRDNNGVITDLKLGHLATKNDFNGWRWFKIKEQIRERMRRAKQ